MGLLNNLWIGYTNLARGIKTKEESTRLKICKSCPLYIPNTNFWCKGCPCHMKAKIKSPKASCVKGYW